MMAALVVAILLYAFATWHFLRRSAQEAQRQRVLCWPVAAASWPEEGPHSLQPAATDALGESIFFHAALTRPYLFYARGEKFTGDRLAPGLNRLNASEASTFLRSLNRHRKLMVYFNPRDPRENYLTVGQPILSFGSLLVFAIYGIAVPTLLICLATGYLPLTETGLILYGVLFTFLALGLVAYFALQPFFDLGSLLVPVPAEAEKPGEEVTPDRLLESLASRPGTTGSSKTHARKEKLRLR